jgi:muramidase (phage lysozyme)
MDPDIVKELNEQIRQLNEMLSQQATAMSGLASSMTSVAPAMKNAADATSKSTTSQNNNTQSINKLGGSVTKLDEIQKKSSQNLADATKNFVAAAHSSGQALRSFKDKLLSAEEGFGKYGDAITKMGNSAFELGKSFGTLGALFGGALKVGSIVLDYQSKQADALFSATDEISRLGAAGTFTVEEIRKMGAGAGLASAELDKLITPMKSVQGGFAGLGGSQSEGIKKFGQLAAVSEETRREFKRLGMGDQERNQSLADYISMMNKSGAAFSGNLKTQNGLQKAALNYTRNLYELAEITGKDTATVAKERETMMATMEVALQQNKWEEERKNANTRLREAKTDSEKQAAQADLDRIEREKAGFEQFNNELQQSALSAEMKAAAQQQFLTGVTSAQSAKFKMYGVDLDKSIDAAKNNKLQKGSLAQDIKVGMQKTLDNLDQRTVGMSEDLQKAYGYDQETIAKLNQQMKYDLRTEAGRAAMAVRDNQKGDSVAALDPAQEMRNDLVEAERKAKLAVDELAASMNPFLGNMGMLKAFGGLAALAAAGLATVVAAKGLSGLLSFFKKGDAPAVPGLDAAPGAAAGASPVSIQEDQLLDKNGKPLKGAARDARMWKLAGDKGATVEPAKKGIGSAIKGIAKSLSDAGAAAPGVIKGAGALAVAITEFGAGIAGAVWIFSKALPSFAEGLKSFKEVDPMNLLGVGLGMVGLGAGILAMGAGTVASAIGNLAKLLTGGKDPFEDISHMLFTMSILDIDPKRVEDNSDALVSFATAMAAISGLGALSGIGNAIKGISESFGSLFGSQTPLEQLVEFSELSIDAKQTKNNALAFKYFAEAMASYEGLGSDVGAIGSVLADATAKFFDVKPPLEQAVYFSHLDINKKKTAINAKSFVLFSEAMSSYKGGPGLLDAVSTIAGAALYKLFQREGPMESFKRFTEMKFGENALKNSTAFFNFAKGIAILSSTGPSLLDTAISAGADMVSSAGAAIAGAVGGALGFSPPGGDKKALDFIGKIESGNNYNKLVGGKVKSNPGLTEMSVADVINYQRGMLASGHESTALGKYQIIKGTLTGLVKSGAVGVNDKFDQSTQDKAAIALMNQRGRTKYQSNKITVDTYADNLSKEWASLPYNTGRSYYAGTGSNKSLVARSDFTNALKARDGGVFTGPKSGYPIEMHGTEMVIPSTPNSVLNKLAQSSNEVSNMTFSALRKSTAKEGDRPARDETTFLSPEMILDLAKKFDNVIGVLEDSQDTNHKILKHSMA